MLTIPKTIEIENLFGNKSGERTTYQGVDGFPVYDTNGVEALFSYGFIFPTIGGKELEYDKDTFFILSLDLTDNTGDLNPEKGVSLLGDVESMRLTLDGEEYQLSEPFTIKGKKSRTGLYQFFLTEKEKDALMNAKSISFWVKGSSAFFEGDVDAKGFHLYSALFSKVYERRKEIVAGSTESCKSLFPMLCTIHDELSGDPDLQRYEQYVSRKENVQPLEDKKVAKGDVAKKSKKPAAKAMTGSMKSLKNSYWKFLNNYKLSREDPKYRSGYVIAEIPAAKITDAGFYNNPNIVNQFMGNTGNLSSSGSQVVDAVIGAVVETQQEKDAHRKIEQAEKETSAKLVLYAVADDPDHFMIDVVFYNRSKNRAMNNPSLDISPSYSESKIEGRTHTFSGKTSFEDVLTVSLPFDYLYSIKGSEALFSFDLDGDKDEDAVIMAFKINYDFADLICVDYLVRGAYWGDEKEKLYSKLIARRAEIAEQMESVATVQNSNKKTVESYQTKGAGYGCLSSLGVMLLLGLLLPDNVGWAIILGIVAFGVVYFLIGKKGKTRIKESEDESLNKEVSLRTELSCLSKEFESVYLSAK